MDKNKLLKEQAISRELAREFKDAFKPVLGKVYDDPRARAFSNPNEATQNNSKPVLSEIVKYHVVNRIPLSENVFRMYSANYFKLYNEVRDLYEHGMYQPSNDFDRELIESDIGTIGKYNGAKVFLDVPFVMKEEEEKKELNKPKRGGSNDSGKFYVYVKDGDSVKKVNFGAKDGGQNLSVKFNDDEARKNFAARHNCKDKNDKTKAGYWACRLPHFAKQLGLSGGGQFFW